MTPNLPDPDADGPNADGPNTNGPEANAPKNNGPDENAPDENRPDETALDAKALARGRWLFAQEPRFLQGATKMTNLPAAGAPEVAFAGRSNVGKSSLINALTNRTTLARTSNTPGRTREINFFALTEGLRLVDLPGYGYARASKSDVKTWTKLVFDFLRGRQPLKRVHLLVDARHGLKPADREAMATFDEAAVSYMIVLTKIDKLKAPAARAIVAETAEAVRRSPACHPSILATSSQKGDGIEDLRAEIASLADWSAIKAPAALTS